MESANRSESIVSDFGAKILVIFFLFLFSSLSQSNLSQDCGSQFPIRNHLPELAPEIIKKGFRGSQNCRNHQPKMSYTFLDAHSLAFTLYLLINQ